MVPSRPGSQKTAPNPTRQLSSPKLSTVLVALLLPRAAASVDSDRLGSKPTPMPLYRAAGGTNAVSVRVGTPPQTMNLTASTTEWYLSIAGAQCQGCSESSALFNATASSSYITSTDHIKYRFNYPSPPADSLAMSGIFGRDAVDVANGTDTPPVFPLVEMTGLTNGTARMPLAAGSAGFWGLGVDVPNRSILPYMHNSQGKSSFTFGLDMRSWDNTPGGDAGVMHWGGVPSSAYLGTFHWLKANASTGWSTPIDTLRINGMTFDMAGYVATFDPGFDEIYLPPALAQRVFVNMNAQRRGDARAYLGCNSNVSMSITLDGRDYAVDPKTLLTSRWSVGVCSSNIVSWSPDSVPGRNEVRLGAAFLSGVYAAFYYSKEAHYVGLAGKPGAINTAHAARNNKVIVGAVLGTLIPLLLILMAVCYFRNRRTVQATLKRQNRRALRAQSMRSAGASVSEGAPMLRQDTQVLPTYPDPEKFNAAYTPVGYADTRGPGPVPEPIPVPTPAPQTSTTLFGSWRRNPFAGLLRPILPTQSNAGGLGLYDPAPAVPYAHHTANTAREYANPYDPAPVVSASVGAKPAGEWHHPIPDQQPGIGRVHQRDFANGYGGSPDPILAALWEGQQRAAAEKQKQYLAVPPQHERPHTPPLTPPLTHPSQGAHSPAEEYARFQQAELDRERSYQRKKAELDDALARRAERERRERRERERDYYAEREARREREKEKEYRATREKWRERERAERGETEHKDKETREERRARKGEAEKRERSRSRDRSGKDTSKEPSRKESKYTSKDTTKSSQDSKERKSKKPSLRREMTKRVPYDPRAAFDGKHPRNKWSSSATVNPPDNM